MPTTVTASCGWQRWAKRVRRPVGASMLGCRVTQAIGRLKRKGQPELERLKRRLEQVYENRMERWRYERDNSGTDPFTGLTLSLTLSGTPPFEQQLHLRRPSQRQLVYLRRGLSRRLRCQAQPVRIAAFDGSPAQRQVQAGARKTKFLCAAFGL